MNPSVVILTERAIAATLGATGAPCAIDRDYPGEYTLSMLPSINLVSMGWEPVDAEADHDSIAIQGEWALMLRAGGVLDTPCSESMDVLLTWVWSRLYFDQQLAGTVRELSVSKSAYQYDRKDDTSVVQCQLDIRARFDVKHADLSANYNTGG